jgi:hypothetical protein
LKISLENTKQLLELVRTLIHGLRRLFTFSISHFALLYLVGILLLNKDSFFFSFCLEYVSFVEVSTKNDLINFPKLVVLISSHT